MTKIFISYRRTDSTWAATPIYEFVKAQLRGPRDHVFMDREELTLGRDFEEHIRTSLNGCDVVLALIGPNWLTALRERLNGSDPDYVRMELASALTRGVPVVPVLLDNAPMPHADHLPPDLKALVKRNGISVGQQNFDADATRLLKGIGVKARRRAGRQNSGFSGWVSWPMLLTLVGTAAIVALQHFLDFEEGDVAPTLIGFGSMTAGVIAAGGHGLASSRSGRSVAFVGSLAGGLAATVGMMLCAGLITPSLAGGYALLVSQLLRDLSCFGAGLSGYLVGLVFRRRRPGRQPTRAPRL